MKIILSFFIILLLSSANTFAQRYLFRMHRFYCSESFNIDLAKPKGFKVVDDMTPFRVNERMDIGMFYQMTLESKAKDCLILFPCFDTAQHRNIAAKNMVYGEVKAALNIYEKNSRKTKKLSPNGLIVIGASNANPDNEKVELDTAKYIQLIAKDNMEDYFNADTVFIYKVRLPKPYKEIYNECIGINVIKGGHPSAMVKILLTEEGKKKEEEYMQILFNSIHYSDIAPEYSQEKKEKVHKRMKCKFILHNKKYRFYF